MTDKISFSVPCGNGDAVLTVDRDGELTVTGYDEEYELAFQAMGGNPSECFQVIKRWDSVLGKMPILIEYVLSCWDSKDVMRLMIKAAKHAKETMNSISKSFASLPPDNGLITSTDDFLGDMQRVADGTMSLKLLYDGNKRHTIVALTNSLYVGRRPASTNYGDAIVNAMEWARDVKAITQPCPPGYDRRAPNSLRSFFDFLAESSLNAMIEAGSYGTVQRLLEVNWQIGATIDMAAEIESRKP